MGVAIMVVAGIGLAVFYCAWKRLSPGSTDLPATAFDLARSTVTLLGVVTIGGAAAVAYRRQITLETQTDLKEKQAALEEKQAVLDEKQALLEHSKEKRAGRADLHARYQQAAAQLGHEKTMIRIAGVYALEALAKEWDALDDGRAQRDVCIDLLCGYLRSRPEFEPSEPTPTVSENAEPTASDKRREVMTAGEADVRLTITTVISRNLRDPENSKKPGPWSNRDYNFTRAFFAPDTAFIGARFGDFAEFSGARFDGDAWFDGARFGQSTRFTDARFGGKAEFGGARFGESVTFARARFDRKIEFARVTFGEFLWFRETRFSKYTVFDWITSASTNISLAGIQVLSPFLVKSLLERDVQMWVPDRDRVL